MIAEAEQLYLRGDYEAALTRLAPHTEHSDIEVLHLVGRCWLRLGAPQEALRLLQHAATLQPDAPLIRLHFGLALQACGRHEEAIGCFLICQALLQDDPAPFLNHAASALMLGRAEEALRLARRARLRAPTRAEAHYTVGLARLALQQYGAAAHAFRMAIRYGPRLAEAWVNLGIASYRQGDIGGAMAAMQNALTLEPRHRAATANLAAFERLTGTNEAAEARLRALLAQDPAAAEVRVNLAAELLFRERPNDALALLDGTPPADAALRHHWLLQLALALLDSGRAKEARALIDTLPDDDAATAPLLAWRRLRLAEVLGDRAAARQEAARMETALAAAPAMTPEHRIMAHYDLARFWSRDEAPDRVFPHWQAGHRLLAQFQPFDRASFHAFTGATLAHFDAARMAAGPRASNRDETPVFVVGMPRSGTTLVEQILSAHRDVHGAGERPELEWLFNSLTGNGTPADSVRRIAGMDTQALDAIAGPYRAQLHALAPGAARIVDKMPANFRLIGLAALVLPAARFIWCERDPRDIALSIYGLRFHGYHPYAHDLADLGWYIGQERLLCAHWRRVLAHRVHIVRLTDWIDDFGATLRALLDFLGLDHDPACARFYMQDRTISTASRHQVRQPINARGVGRWRGYRRHLAPVIAALKESGALAGWDTSVTLE